MAWWNINYAEAWVNLYKNSYHWLAGYISFGTHEVINYPEVWANLFKNPQIPTNRGGENLYKNPSRSIYLTGQQVCHLAFAKAKRIQNHVMCKKCLKSV